MDQFSVFKQQKRQMGQASNLDQVMRTNLYNRGYIRVRKRKHDLPDLFFYERPL